MESLFSITDFMPEESKCADVLRKLRWGDGPIKCPRCTSERIKSNGTYHQHYHKFYCHQCKRSFTEKTGTIFDNSKLTLSEWFYIARELQRNISMNQIHKDLGIAYQHVMHASHKLMDSVYMKRLVELEGEDIEVDEMYQSAGSKGKKQTERKPRKRGLKLRGRGTYDKDKPPIVAVVARKGKAVIEMFHDLSKRNIDAFLYNVTGRFFHTDDFRIYWHLDDEPGIVHESVNHSRKEYAAGYKHTNTVEGLYSGLRTWLRRYKGVSKDNMYKFVSLFQFNYNHRELHPMLLLDALLETVFLGAVI
jgi:transposase-like protein